MFQSYAHVQAVQEYMADTSCKIWSKKEKFLSAHILWKLNQMFIMYIESTHKNNILPSSLLAEEHEVVMFHDGWLFGGCRAAWQHQQ